MLGREEPDLGEERRFWRLTSVAMQRVVRTMDRAALTGGHLSPTPMAAPPIEFAAPGLHSGSKGNLPVAWERPGKRSMTAERVNAIGFASAYYVLCADGVVPDPD